jgi:predicted amidohydrolase
MKRARHWDALLNARAIENQCYVVGVNRVGSDEKGLDYSGGSKLVSALGETTTLPQENEGIQTLILNRDELLDVRAKLPFLKDL